MTPKHILLTENEKNLAHIIALMLKQADYRVSMANDYRDALKTIALCHGTGDAVDLLITDMDLVSEEACRTFLLSFSESKIRIPYLVIAEDASDGLVDVLKNNGCRACLTKPFEPGKLMENVKTALFGIGA